MSEIVEKFKLKRIGKTSLSFTRDQIYPVYHSEMGKYTHYAFYMVDDCGHRHYFNTLNGQIDSESTYLASENWEVIRTSKEEKTPILTDGMILVCTKANDEYANFKEGHEYAVQGDHDEPYIKSEGNTPWFGWELEKLAKFGTTFMVKEVEVEPETPPHTITITGHDWVDLEKNLRDAYRKVKLLSKASEKFDESTAELAKRVLEYKKIGGQ